MLPVYLKGIFFCKLAYTSHNAWLFLLQTLHRKDTANVKLWATFIAVRSRPYQEVSV
jgi:hypothetical protein